MNRLQREITARYSDFIGAEERAKTAGQSRWYSARSRLLCNNLAYSRMEKWMQHAFDKLPKEAKMRRVMPWDDSTSREDDFSVYVLNPDYVFEEDEPVDDGLVPSDRVGYEDIPVRLTKRGNLVYGADGILLQDALSIKSFMDYAYINEHDGSEVASMLPRRPSENGPAIVPDFVRFYK